MRADVRERERLANDVGPLETSLPNGWVVRDCDGERTNVCVYDGTQLLGDVELLSGYPLSPTDDPSDPQGTAITWAQRMITTFRDERAVTCPGFAFAPLEIRDVRVGGRSGARGGFTLTDASGRVVEHVINHYVLVDGAMNIVNTDAYATSGGCLPPSDIDPSFTPDRLAELDNGVLDRLVAGSPATAS